MRLNEFASMGGTSSGGIATVATPLNKKPIKREDVGESDQPWKEQERQWKEWVSNWNSSVKAAAQRGTIMGQPFEPYVWVDDETALLGIQFDFGGKQWKVIMGDETRKTFGVSIELSAEGHNGRVPPKKLTGKNATIQNVISKIEHLFDHGTW